MEAVPFQNLLAAYWSQQALTVNTLLFLNLLGALLLGSLVGYERAYHGRAAGMRTYGLVCMASAGLTAIAGYPGLWFGGQHIANIAPDPTRVMQGIVTGIGFLGAGVIVKEGLNISGLTTAASIWAASCIGVLIGVGFYAAAMLLALLCSAAMMWGSRLEAWLPAHPALQVTLRLNAAGTLMPSDEIGRVFAALGYDVASGSFSLHSDPAGREVRFVVVAVDKRRAAPMDAIARRLEPLEGVTGFALTHARN
ncbi:MAG: MgtC/SapB family protein [Burkholderiales bacterium]